MIGRSVILVVISFIVISCGQKQDKQNRSGNNSTVSQGLPQYEKHGIRFSRPKDWKIKADDTIKSGSYIVEVENKGWKESGLVMFCIVDGTVDPDRYIMMLVDDLKQKYT